MNARAIMKRLREEKKVREEKVTAEDKDEKETVPVAPRRTTTSNHLLRNTTTATSSRSRNTIPVKRYDESVLTERRVHMSDSSLTIHLLEDPTGSWAGGNGATLWDCSLALTDVLVQRATVYEQYY